LDGFTPTNLSAVYPTGRLASTKARAFVSSRHQRIGQPAVSKAVVQLEEWLGS
jgi:hypothetical protein